MSYQTYWPMPIINPNEIVKIPTGQHNKMNIIQTLRSARGLISSSKNFTRQYSARDMIGDMCEPESMYAVCWCARGAIHKVANNSDEAYRAQDALSASLPPDDSLNHYNDTHSHEDVLGLFDITIARLERMGYEA